jgi:hypothetical protein
VVTRTRILALVCLAVFGFAAGPARAQMTSGSQPAAKNVMFGGQVSYATDMKLGVGVRAVGNLEAWVPSAKNISVVGSFDFFFPGTNQSYWELNANGLYRLQIADMPSVAPYVGAGLDIDHYSISSCPATISCSSTNVGLNLLAGTWFKSMGTIVPFVEAKVELRSGTQFIISGGVLF